MSNAPNIERMQSTALFQQLTTQQQKALIAYLESGGGRGSKVRAIQSAYHVGTPQSAAAMASKLFSLPAIIACIGASNGLSPERAHFHAKVEKMSQDKNVTKNQIACMRLIAQSNGWLKTPAVKEDEESQSVPTVVSDPRVPPSALKVWLDAKGACIGYRDADGIDVRL